MYICLECGQRYKSTRAAQRAIDNGCRKCGGVDIDIATTIKTPTNPNAFRRAFNTYIDASRIGNVVGVNFDERF